MADFRKLFLVLAVVALLTGSAVTANAQGFQCTAFTGATPPLLRAEGLTELLGDLQLQCWGPVPAEGITANIRIFTNGGTVTSKLLSTTAPFANEALLIIDEAGTPTGPAQLYRAFGSPPSPAGNVYQGAWNLSGFFPNSVDWVGVPLVPPGTPTTIPSTSPKIYRFTNVRVNATEYPVGIIPPQVTLTVTISGNALITLTGLATQNVGVVVPGMTTSVTARTFKQCETPPTTVPLTYTESFSTSFKKQSTALSQTVPGFPYNTEDGLFGIPSAPAALGRATNGTRLMGRFTSIPSGVTLSIPGTVSGTGSLLLYRVSGPGANGEGGSLSTASATITPVAGVAMVVYEVVAADPFGTLESVTIPITVVYPAAPALPGLGTASVNQSFGPAALPGTATLTTWSRPQVDPTPIPRFLDSSTPRTAFTISACRTILLFPYVVQIGTTWNTGIAISNTSSDAPVFTTVGQSGACDLNWYGVNPLTGVAPTVPRATTPVVAAGEQLVFTMSDGGAVVGATAAAKLCGQCAQPNFQGYMIAVCNFQFAHAFAYVSDYRNERLAQGYLALVIPDRTRVAQNAALGALANEGEQLGQ